MKSLKVKADLGWFINLSTSRTLIFAISVILLATFPHVCKMPVGVPCIITTSRVQKKWQLILWISFYRERHLSQNSPPPPTPLPSLCPVGGFLLGKCPCLFPHAGQAHTAGDSGGHDFHSLDSWLMGAVLITEEAD